MNSRIVKICLCFILIFMIDYCGIFVHFFEINYSFFEYPALQSGGDDNVKQYNYTYLRNPAASARNERSHVDSHHIHVLLLIKSAIANGKQRNAIRRTWGSSTINAGSTRCIFLIGQTTLKEERQWIEEEYALYGDIVQIDFVDTYYNNTIKTVMGMRWALEYQSHMPYMMFVDDDYYVSIKNVIKLLIYYEQDVQYNTNDMFVGFVIQSAPHRHKFSKWYTSLEEYPFDQWPPYVTAGAYLLSNITLQRLYQTAMRIPYFRYDDVYMGIVALKANVTLTHSQHFHFHRPTFNFLNNCGPIIASHGFSDPFDLENIWTNCHSIKTL